MKYFTLVIAIILFCNSLMAEPCFPNGITFTTQTQIDDFAMNYPDCTQILGDVLIDDGTPNPAITSLLGLNQLNDIAGNLRIRGNNGLESLTGLENLTSVGGNLDIEYHYDLLSLSGLENLISIGGNLAINGNLELLNLTGLGNLATIGGNLSINTNDKLTSLTGLENLTSMDGDLSIFFNFDLINLAGLDNLTTIGGNLTLEWNDALSSLNALSNVTSINGEILIDSHYSLASLIGLENINYTGITYLTLALNDNLSICGLPNICDYLNNGGPSTIELNSYNCYSEAAILSTCITAIEHQDILSKTAITPNPNTGLFEVTGIAEGDYTILNTAGQIIQVAQLSSDLSIDISTAPQGVYFMSITVGEQVLVKRIVKI